MASIERMIESFTEQPLYASREEKRVKLQDELDIAVEREIQTRIAEERRRYEESESGGVFLDKAHSCKYPKGAKKGDRWRCNCGRKYEVEIFLGSRYYSKDELLWREIGSGRFIASGIDYSFGIRLYTIGLLFSFILFSTLALTVHVDWVFMLIVTALIHAGFYIASKVN